MIFTNNGAASGESSTGGYTFFTANSSAGSGTFTNNGGADRSGNGSGHMRFSDNATAANAAITNNGGKGSGAFGGGVEFFGFSNAGNAIVTNNPALHKGASGGGMSFIDDSSAGNATIVNNGASVMGSNPPFESGGTSFRNRSSAGTATLIANGGSAGGPGGIIGFETNATGGTARVEVFGNGMLQILGTTPPKFTVGSIEGDGIVLVEARNLIVGGNNLDTVFSGVIKDSGTSFGIGSLTKNGKGKLTLSGANTYAGGTTVSKGTLLMKNKNGSGTGTGAIQVNAGTLGGTGKIAGAVTVGTGSSSGGILLPGNSSAKPGTLTINSTLTFNSQSAYECVLKRTTPKASMVVALGVTTNTGVQFIFNDVGSGALTKGTVFTVINNTSSSTIAGTFSNLADGSTFTDSNGTTFKANYEGGDGNDLTLTVQ